MENKGMRLRNYILIGLVIMLPVLFSFYSPVLIVWGIEGGVITASIIIFAAWFILSLFMGRSVSCGYSCPYGALQEIFGGKVLKKKPKSEASKIRYLVFGLFLLIMLYFTLKIGGMKALDLFASNGAYSASQSLILIPISIMAIALLAMIFGSRAFCRYLCPQGVFLTIGARLGKKIRIPSLHLTPTPENCSNCKLCDKSCPMGLKVNHMVTINAMDNDNCILCGECIDKCPKDAINYSFHNKN
ncbi:MAG: 4Fe-4S binding protein [Methanobacterium formicicum]